MLNGVLIVGMPMVALLAAAFYIFRRTQQEEQSQSPVARARGHPKRYDCKSGLGMRSRQPTSTIPQHRRRVRAGNGDENIDDDDHLASSSSDCPDSGFVDHEEQCEICFESEEKVQLYPCKHSDICRGCVIKLLVSSKEKRKCPFCRRRIDGYMEMGGSTELLG